MEDEERAELIRDAALGDPGEEEEADYLPTCPMCDGYGVYLGTLGKRRHFRCRDCGVEFSRIKK